MCALKKGKITEKMSTLSLENIYQYYCYTTTETSDREYYSEVMSEYVLGKKERLQKCIKNNAWKIEPSKGLSYFSNYRTNIEQAKKQADGKKHFEEDDEKIICRDMYIRCRKGACYEGIGKIIDFETPLAHLRKDEKEKYLSRKVGKVDMISFSFEDKPIIWLLEVKNKKNKESMYRCVMEGFTYLQTIDRVRFLEDLKKRDAQFKTIGESLIFRTAPLIAYEGNQYQEMREASEKPYRHKKLLELMNFLDITIYFSYQIESDGITIRKHFI